MVTGGSGLVGCGIRQAIETTEKRGNEEWIFLTSKDGNLLDLKETEALFEKYQPTHVIHLAALVRFQTLSRFIIMERTDIKLIQIINIQAVK